jgi:uncharacterized Fe-S cluster-containing radical SAM superfamily enzyme
MTRIPQWIRNLFVETKVESLMLQEELFELSTNEELKVEFKRGSQIFWLPAEIPNNILDCGEFRYSF